MFGRRWPPPVIPGTHARAAEGGKFGQAQYGSLPLLENFVELLVQATPDYVLWRPPGAAVLAAAR